MGPPVVMDFSSITQRDRESTTWPGSCGSITYVCVDQLNEWFRGWNLIDVRVIISMMVLCSDIFIMEHDGSGTELPDAPVVIEHDNYRAWDSLLNIDLNIPDRRSCAHTPTPPLRPPHPPPPPPRNHPPLLPDPGLTGPFLARQWPDWREFRGH